MKIRIHRASRNIALFMFAALTAEVYAVPALAQDRQQDPTRIKLARLVHLNFGVTTVDKVMSALSDQTGLTIKAAEYLRERTLTMHIDNVSAATALEALNALNDWTWSATQPGQILVTRRRLRTDSIAAAIPRLMQAAIPNDMRTFMHIAKPIEDMKKYNNPFEGSFGTAKRAAFDRLMRPIVADQTDLFTSLAPGILSGERIPFAKLTPRQRSELLVALVFPLLRETDYELLHGDVLPHVADVNNAVLQFSGPTTLLVGSEINDGKTTSGAGFGAQIR